MGSFVGRDRTESDILQSAKEGSTESFWGRSFFASKASAQLAACVDGYERRCIGRPRDPRKGPELFLPLDQAIQHIADLSALIVRQRRSQRSPRKRCYGAPFFRTFHACDAPR